MMGELDLDRLLGGMAPQLHHETYVYCSLPDFRLPAGLDPICTFREAEGLTAIVQRAQAENANVPYVFETRLITLAVHSSLEAIGFLATVATRLAKAGIPCNAVAAYHHDHLFVPVAQASDAMSLLVNLASSAQAAAPAQTSNAH
jgi:hypothetical protein